MPLTHPTVEDRPAAHDLQFVEEQIDRYNRTRTGASDDRALAIFVRDERQRIVAGLTGFSWAGMCEVQNFWVHEDERRRGHGGRLLEAAEREALGRGCSIVVLGTYSFQAPEFYQRRGYELVGRVEDCPPGHTNYYLKKVLRAGAADGARGERPG